MKFDRNNLVENELSEEELKEREAVCDIIEEDSRVISEKIDAILATFNFKETTTEKQEGSFSIVLDGKNLAYERRALTVLAAFGSVLTKITIILGDTRENILAALDCLMADDDFIQSEQEKLKQLPDMPPSQDLH